MDRNEQVLSLIGLCLRGRNLEVGEEPVEAVSRARDARVILLASDGMIVQEALRNDNFDAAAFVRQSEAYLRVLRPADRI